MENIKNQGFHTHPERINRNGRPRKLTTAMAEIGYTNSQVNDCIKVMLALTESELREWQNNPTATILECTIASALLNGMEKGNLNAIESLLTRTYGRPTQPTTLLNQEPITIVFQDGTTIL
jgi:hypothetical protein